MNSTLLALGLILVLEGLSAFVAAFLMYAAFLTVSAERRHGVARKLLDSAVRGGGFLVAVGASLALIHAVASSYGMAPAAATLFLTLSLCAAIYFPLVREHWKGDRIQYAMMLWAMFWIFIGLLLLFLSWITQQGVTFVLAPVDGQSFAQYVATFAQLAGIIIAATMVIITNRHNAREADATARQQIYQTLELESVKLFRFECDHPELVHMLWFSDDAARVALEELARGPSAGLDLDKVSSPMQVRLYQLKQYTCHILNLFEMACKFRTQSIIDPDIFGSWVIWMWELCAEPMFQLQWKGEKGIEFNYITDLREIMNAGIHFNVARAGEGLSASDRIRSFYNFVAHQLFPESEREQRELVERWLDQPASGTGGYQKFWHQSAVAPVA